MISLILEEYSKAQTLNPTFEPLSPSIITRKKLQNPISDTFRQRALVMTPSIIMQRNEANQVTCIDAMQMALLATDPQGCGYNDRDAWTSSY